LWGTPHDARHRYPRGVGTDHGDSRRRAQVAATRQAILDAAERLFAEHGLHAVSNRQISAAAGQGNNAAVGYHFGSKDQLVREIVRRRSAPIEAIRQEMVAAVADSDMLRDWIACVVEPVVRYAVSLPQPTWYFRFNAQVATDPALGRALAEEAMTAPALASTVAGIARCLPPLADDVRAARNEMTALLIVQLYAVREREVAADPATAADQWSTLATTLVDALTGLWTAPVRRADRR
jgi:AcrR family transcriptional regulator